MRFAEKKTVNRLIPVLSRVKLYCDLNRAIILH